MSYLALKTAHVSLAVVSVAGFAARGLLMLTGSATLDARWVRTAPHVVDAALLTTGITMAWLIRASPIAQPWLGAKLLALVAYILLGMVALRRGRTMRIRSAAFIGALVIVGYIVLTAVRRSPLPI